MSLTLLTSRLALIEQPIVAYPVLSDA
jgi:hypothetical protein